MVKTETLILKHLLDDESFTRRTLPYLKPDYFSDRTEKLVYQAIDKFVNKYNNLPTREALIIEIDSENSISDEDFSNCKSVISDLVIDMQGLVKSALVARMIPSIITLGFDQSSLRESLAAKFYNQTYG